MASVSCSISWGIFCRRGAKRVLIAAVLLSFCGRKQAKLHRFWVAQLPLDGALQFQQDGFDIPGLFLRPIRQLLAQAVGALPASHLQRALQGRFDVGPNGLQSCQDVGRGKLIARGPQEGAHFTHTSDSAKPALADFSAHLQHFLMQAMAQRAGHDQAGVGHNDGRIRQMTGNEAGGDAMQTPRAARAPHLGPQQAQGPLHQGIVEMRQHHVIPAPGQIRVEDQGATLAGVGML